MFTRSNFRPIRNILNGIASTSASAVSKINSSDYGLNFDITVCVSTGNVYISTLTTTLTSTNGFMLKEGDVLDLQVRNYLALLGDSTTAAYRAIVWD